MNQMNRCLLLFSGMLIITCLWLVLTPNPPIPRQWVFAGIGLAYAPLSETFQKWVDRKTVNRTTR